MEFVSNSNTQTLKNSNNLYVHFPFCRRKCSYCALYSRAGVSQEDRDAYVRRLADEIDKLGQTGFVTLKTIYFGGGSPALCDLRPVLDALLRGGAVSAAQSETEFTVELHPLDVTEDLLNILRDRGVNRISMGVQSLNDAVLADMGRGYTVDGAERAFALVKRYFDNAGIDLIVGYPGDEVGNAKAKNGYCRRVGDGIAAFAVPPPSRRQALARAGRTRPTVTPPAAETAAVQFCSPVIPNSATIPKNEGEQWNLKRLESWGLRHCSVYSLQNERGLKNVPDDDTVLDRLRHIAICLGEMGLERYEISNYAAPGYECRHNLAVWRGEDYVGLGDGACGRIGLKRTKFGKEEVVSPDFDEKERRLFRLRTREGLDASGHPEWGQTLEKHVRTGLLTQSGSIYRLTERGTEVCDSILADLV